MNSGKCNIKTSKEVHIEVSLVDMGIMVWCIWNERCTQVHDKEEKSWQEIWDWIKLDGNVVFNAKKFEGYDTGRDCPWYLGRLN